MPVLTSFDFQETSRSIWLGENIPLVELGWNVTPPPSTGSPSAVKAGTTYSSSDPTVATIAYAYGDTWSTIGSYASFDTRITAVGAGTADLTATYTDDNNVTWTTTISVEVKEHVPVIVNEDYLEDIADSIRALNGASTTYKPGEMAGAIAANAASIPREIKTWTPSSSETYQQLCIPEVGYPVFSLPDYVTALGQYALAYAFYADTTSSAASHRSLRELNLGNVKNIGDHSLYYCCHYNYLLESIDLSSATGISSYGMAWAFRGCSKLTGNIDLGNVTYVNSYGLSHAFFEASRITSLDLSSVSGSYINAFEYMCSRCTSLTSVDLSSISAVDSNAFSHAFEGCTALTSIDLSGITSLDSASFEYVCSGCTSLSTIELPNISVYSKGNVFRYAFQNCTSLTGALDLSGITSISGSTFENAFYGCTGITSVDLSDLETITGSSALRSAFEGCTGLTGSVSFSKLQTTGASNHYYTMQQTFKGCTSLTEVRFPVLSTTSQGHWTNMLSGCTGVTVHFPAAMQSTMGSWSQVTGGFGGTNTTVLFDL